MDRKEELIKVLGEQIAHAELKMVLRGHEGVLDGAVVGVRVDDGERPRVYIVPRPGAQGLTEESLLAWLKPRVAPHKKITGGVAFVDTIPRNRVSCTSWLLFV